MPSQIRKIRWETLPLTDMDFLVQFESAACSNNTLAAYYLANKHAYFGYNLHPHGTCPSNPYT